MARIRNHFNLSEERKMSFNMGTLYPIYCQEVLPGDKFHVSTELFIRCMDGLKAPIMHRVNVYTHFFFVPNRIIWKGWPTYIGFGKKGDQKDELGTTYDTIPKIQLNNNVGGVGSLADHMGIGSYKGTWATNYINVNAFPFGAYQKIVTEYYRDENLKDDADKLDSMLNSLYNAASAAVWSTGDDFNNIMSLRQRSWEKDYFTSALPWTQRGVEQNIGTTTATDEGYLYTANTAEPGAAPNIKTFIDSTWPNGSEHAPQSYAAGLVTVNDIRKAFQIQKFLERNARAGWRYVEQILAHFGVHSPDERLQRPEYLGGAKSPIIISEVQQTTDKGTGLGKLGGSAMSATGGHGFKKFFTEHGYIIGILSMLPRTNYSEGIPRHFLKQNAYDYAFPEFSHLGEQPVYNCELLYNPGSSGGSGWNMQTFGYQPRYEEYRRPYSTLAGQVGDPSNASLCSWHMGRIFGQGNNPALNLGFVTSDPTSRIYNTTDGDHWVAEILHHVNAIRPLARNANPGMIDHF